MSFWARLGGGSDSGVCKECNEQGRNRLQLLVRSVGAVQAWKQQYAQGWITQCEEIIRKYQLPEGEAGPLRSALLNEIFKLVEAEEEMSETDLNFLIGLGQRYALAQSATPELRDTVLRIALRQAIQSWEHGDVPRRGCTSPVPLRGEICHWEEPAGLLIQRTKREYVGGSGGVSVPVGHGVRVRLGAFRAVPIDKTIYESGGAGILHITNQRICLTGQQQSVAIPYKKVINLAGFKDGFEVQTSSAKKPGIFLVPHPELTVQLITLASSQQEGGEGRSPRRKKLPLPA